MHIFIALGQHTFSASASMINVYIGGKNFLSLSVSFSHIMLEYFSAYTCSPLSALYLLPQLEGWNVQRALFWRGWLAVCVYPSRCGPVKRPENSVKIQPYNSRPTLCPKSRI